MQTLTVEDIQLALATTLLDDLSSALADQFERPIRWLERANDSNRMTWRELVMAPDPLQELWTQQQIMLNFPALLIHYQETASVDATDCGERDHTAFFFLDLILVHPHAEVLSGAWLRYAEAIKQALRSQDFPFRLQLTGQRITETGPQESLFLRRGLIDVQITF